MAEASRIAQELYLEQRQPTSGFRTLYDALANRRVALQLLGFLRRGLIFKR